MIVLTAITLSKRTGKKFLTVEPIHALNKHCFRSWKLEVKHICHQIKVQPTKSREKNAFSKRLLSHALLPLINVVFDASKQGGSFKLKLQSFRIEKAHSFSQ